MTWTPEGTRDLIIELRDREHSGRGSTPRGLFREVADELERAAPILERLRELAARKPTSFIEEVSVVADMRLLLDDVAAMDEQQYGGGSES